jgi:hypothetical protein
MITAQTIADRASPAQPAQWSASHQYGFAPISTTFKLFKHLIGTFNTYIGTTCMQVLIILTTLNHQESESQRQPSLATIGPSIVAVFLLGRSVSRQTYNK